MPSNHATVGASSSERWINCPPSVRLEEQFPNETSVYAEEGTKAHALCELKLRHLKNGEDLGGYMVKGPNGTALIKLLDEVLEYPMDMWNFTEQYKDYVEELWAAAKATDSSATLLVEQRLDLSAYIPEGFGTSDAVIVTDGTLHVIDFKYGMGVPVSAEGNPQLRLYALGAYEALKVLYDINTVTYHVFQPRIYNASSESMKVSALRKWAKEVVKPRAKLAYDGEGEYSIGDWCRFCRAGGVCRARAEAAFSVVDREHDLPPVLDDEEIPAILDKLDETEKWIAAIRKYALSKAIEGTKWAGYKLVESRTNRKITSEIEAANRLKAAGFELEDYTNTKLKGITDLEKLIGKKKFPEVLGDLVIKPTGEPTLVPESDKREEIIPAALAFNDDLDIPF